MTTQAPRGWAHVETGAGGTTITYWEARRYVQIVNRLAEQGAPSQELGQVLNEADELYGKGSAAYIADVAKRDRGLHQQMMTPEELERLEESRVVRAKQRAEHRGEAREQLEQVNKTSVMQVQELAEDIYGTAVVAGGLRATIYMDPDGTFWAEVSRDGYSVSESHHDTLYAAAQWAVWEIKDAARTRR